MPRTPGDHARSTSPPEADFPVVAIGASAGGLEACRKLLAALPEATGLAFILVQHLDPNHDSMLVELLSGHTGLTVLQAAEGMRLAPDHLYVIPPGASLAVADGTLHLSQPLTRHGIRLPFDFLLNSLAESCGPRTVGVVLSGSGADGSLGVPAVKAAGGMVLVQDPLEAGFDGMPRSAIATGAVDKVLTLVDIATALVTRSARPPAPAAPAVPGSAKLAADSIGAIIDLLRRKTAHDFTLYKPGTLHRRIERRMAMAGVRPDHAARYLEILERDPDELESLAKDLLINVTSFFRDPQVFEYLAAHVLPDMIAGHAIEQPMRLWIAGCSTGEETYSLTMLAIEAITAAKSPLKLQVFASDVDTDAVASAREGLYPATIAADVSPDRLARFFQKSTDGYRVSADLRATIVFATQDVLSDPPFSTLDLVSCRNLLIYLRPEAQEKVIAALHFALRPGGVLLLGSAETAGNIEGRFKVISKAERLYRRIGSSSRTIALGAPRNLGDATRTPSRPGQGMATSRQTALAELCRRIVIETYAPAAVLVNASNECVYSLGPTDRYLRVPPGNPTLDLMAMARPALRTKLRAAINLASQQKTRSLLSSGTIDQGENGVPFDIAVQPLSFEGDEFMLICFVDANQPGRSPSAAAKPDELPLVAQLERELATTRQELQGAIRNLEISSEEQKAINEEALSSNEEYQSTNEELLTSKEELQSLNEELTALNSQLQETLERQRTTSNDLQNVLYSTDLATLFLDVELKIRFFTPATRSLFSVIPSDVGRPLADLNSLATDSALSGDAREVMKSLTPIEREIQVQNGTWFIRRVLPYRTHDDGVEGVVITFTDITERKRTARALEAATHEAELANIAKTRFLAAANHDLRQPLQTLALLQGLLAKRVEGERAQKLVARLDETLGAMSGMLNTLLDINQIETGSIRADIAAFPIATLLRQLKDEFDYHAQAQGLSLHVVPCSLMVNSDPRLLEQIIRNLLSNALKYTERGKILVGCRRHAGMLSVEVWDTGKGIPKDELGAIFEEYHQIDNAARERSRGLGLGLSIVRRLATLLDHQVDVRSTPGKGSCFAVEIAMPTTDGIMPRAVQAPAIAPPAGMQEPHRTGFILIVEDDQEVRELLELSLKDDGHRTHLAADGKLAVEWMAKGFAKPDVILADYNLPNGPNGLQLIAQLREIAGADTPAAILTGDISTTTLREIARHNCLQFNKPLKLRELMDALQRLLPPPPLPANKPQTSPSTTTERATIFVVDDDPQLRNALRSVLEDDNLIVEDYADCESFLAAFRPGREACLLIDAYLPGMGGLELLGVLAERRLRLPAIMITGNSDVAMAVQAMKAGASDFIEKPVSRDDLVASIDRALEQSRDSGKLLAYREDATTHLAGLTLRQRQIMELVLAGHPSKNIAADLGISQRTVENHRASIMKRTGSKSLPALARLALAAATTMAD